jgi:HD-GYP domain-containing protein (c-di-GMP phosphodiesterase class II)
MGSSGEARMADTPSLLERISALRQRLDIAATGDAAPTGPSTAGHALFVLEQRLSASQEHGQIVETAVRQLVEEKSQGPMPSRLTNRARRLLERGRELLTRLDALSSVTSGQSADPLADLYRELVAMTDATVRLMSALPDSATGQLRLCRGLGAVLDTIVSQTAGLEATLALRSCRQGTVEDLAAWLADCCAGKSVSLDQVRAVVSQLDLEARTGTAIYIYEWHGQETVPQHGVYETQSSDSAHRIACHSLVAAQACARMLGPRGLPDHERQDAIMAALLHDVGMLAVPEDSWICPDPITDERRRAIEQHAPRGAELLSRVEHLPPALIAVAAAHHERLDGTGYPGGLLADRIDPLTRFVTIADVYAAQCADRPHRPAKDIRSALTDTLVMADRGLLDRSLAQRLLALSFYPNGVIVELSDGSIARVISAPPIVVDVKGPARPVVALLTAADGSALAFPRYVDLGRSEGPSIVRSLPSSECRLRLGKHYPELAA